MSFKTFLITPPFTQLNTPYPATQYLSGFLKSKGEDIFQYDLSIDLFNQLFNSAFIQEVFNAVHPSEVQLNSVWKQRDSYIHKVDIVVQYLQKPETTTAYLLLNDDFLPQGHRSDDGSEELDWAFGNLGILDKAKYRATLFIEELGDFIQAHIDPFFAFTKYGEQIARSASSFNPIEIGLSDSLTLVEEVMLRLLKKQIEQIQPNLIGFTIPFPGNLFSALRCSQFIKTEFPLSKIVFGGGYCNTELRSLKDSTIFKYTDYITLDDGEIPIWKLIRHLSGNLDITELERTYTLQDQKVVYINHQPNTIAHHQDLPTPTYWGLELSKYLSFLDVMNPMHRLWSDGRWNKLTIAHGCYWKQCSFCDINLDYIGNYQNTTATDLVNKIEVLIKETSTRGFHFVDEAAPPKMLRALAEELIQRKVHISWWTNIRFEKTFDKELCALLAKSGCIAVTGGLEVASDRLLELMQKGVSIEQVTRVTNAFSSNNILVHAYLMYGFPSQTAQETIDALEVVRQLFLNGCIHSAFWHLFTATVHSPVGKNPQAYQIQITGPTFEGFAQNDLEHEDPTGANHRLFRNGLNEALDNYLQGLGLDMPVHEWFDFEVPTTTHATNMIKGFI